MDAIAQVAYTAHMQKRMQAIVSGRVQLVMFRDFVQRKARKKNITGWVKNLPDNTVKVVAEGDVEDLEWLLEKLHEGPVLAEVEDVAVKWYETATGEFKHFLIHHE